LESLVSLRRLERISPEVALSEFINTFNRSLEDNEYKVCSKDIAGVQVLDAMSARAIPFRVLFVTGMNEKVFPRNIREDPLLRDPVRQVMERVLGYKIEEKLNGFEEEKLLFYLLVNSAKRGYNTLPETDDSGETKFLLVHI
jgi:ATP-dependent helicase/DNAse subunit B